MSRDLRGDVMTSHIRQMSKNPRRSLDGVSEQMLQACAKTLHTLFISLTSYLVFARDNFEDSSIICFRLSGESRQLVLEVRSLFAFHLQTFLLRYSFPTLNLNIKLFD